MPSVTFIDAYDKTLESGTKQNSFQGLVRELSDILRPSSGPDAGKVDPHKIMNLMTGYKSDEQQWEKYAFKDMSKTFTRNLVDEGNGKSNLVCPLLWLQIVYNF